MELVADAHGTIVVRACKRVMLDSNQEDRDVWLLKKLC